MRHRDWRRWIQLSAMQLRRDHPFVFKKRYSLCSLIGERLAEQYPICLLLLPALAINAPPLLLFCILSSRILWLETTVA